MGVSRALTGPGPGSYLQAQVMAPVCCKYLTSFHAPSSLSVRSEWVMILIGIDVQDKVAVKSTTQLESVLEVRIGS